MKHKYKKPTIEIKNWFVSSDHIKRLHEFFTKRFPESDIEISLETESGHTRIYETLDEYYEDLPKLIADSEVVSTIQISERESGAMHHYKQAWIDIGFGKYSGAAMHVIGGDTDETNKDWVEGTYTEALKLKDIFEVNDKNVLKYFGVDRSQVVFDPEGTKYNDAKNSREQKEDKPQQVEVVNNQLTWYQKPFGQIVIGLIIAVVAGIILLNL